MERIVVCLTRGGHGGLLQAARRAHADGGALQVLVPTLEFVDPEGALDEAQQMLERSASDVPAALQVVTGDADEAILEHASGADVVVMG